MNDAYWMRRALALANLAAEAGEVPVGALLIKDGREIATGWNRPIGDNDPTAHAEIVALRAGALALGNYRLPDAWLYVTLEPCVMCAGAIIQARLAGVVFGADDPKAGAAGSVFQVLGSDTLNHRSVCRGGVCAGEARAILQAFFAQRRKASSRLRRGSPFGR
uniref:tRNA-specific adenosine deaminase n=1 Tax=Candidatus Kentrum sp. SD TaxID=2126332 RepID=A0A450YD36_9GAMM|nr:MAG: tRNA(adenine34) deaminase [Candidatus Kentron sp. SD]VFK43681.1 MAG: tRNA(adenine34) deaminase [Candidatus Kentron sp. SD]VFK79257.1 MAG: tRNA(adenine34) deaminase [Candidatus Kentron sp. SD]